MSREYWIAYDPATGIEQQRGSGPAGAAAGQPSEGCAILLVPKETFRLPGPLVVDPETPFVAENSQ